MFSYQFCGLSAEITVYAENEAEARAKAVDQLRLRGLKVAWTATATPPLPPPWSVEEGTQPHAPDERTNPGAARRCAPQLGPGGHGHETNGARRWKAPASH